MSFGWRRQIRQTTASCDAEINSPPLFTPAKLLILFSSFSIPLEHDHVISVSIMTSSLSLHKNNYVSLLNVPGFLPA